MQDSSTQSGHVLVRYWAAAKSAAGVAEEEYVLNGPSSMAEVLAAITERHGRRSRLVEVLETCSFLLGDRPVSAEDPTDVIVRPGDRVEVLPPFAGG